MSLISDLSLSFVKNICCPVGYLSSMDNAGEGFKAAGQEVLTNFGRYAHNTSNSIADPISKTSFDIFFHIQR